MAAAILLHIPEQVLLSDKPLVADPNAGEILELEKLVRLVHTNM